MGGDGGVVATNRLYMRGAGSADHTADSSRASSKDVAEAEKERLQQTMRMCAITGTPFVFTPEDGAGGGDGGGRGKQVGGIVACPYGRLYTREAAVNALLRRLEQHGSHEDGSTTTPEIGWHVRGLRDLHPVRFYVVDQSTDEAAGAGNSDGGGGMEDRVFFPACPIAGTDLNGLHPTYLITHKKKTKKKKKKTNTKDDSQEYEGPNVLSEKALKEMGFESLQEEYGPFQKDDLIRLAPPTGTIFDAIREELTLRRERDSLTTATTKKKRKGKPPSDGAVRPEGVMAVAVVPPSSKRPRSSNRNSAIGRESTADTVRKNVAAAVASSAALSSLFGKDKRSHLSEKEKNNNLFVR